MSVGSMFSSPGKQASSAAQASGQEAQQIISQLQNYTDTHQQQLRDAIAGMGANPYFGAAQQLNPQAYHVDPGNTATFSSGGPGSGLTGGQSLTPSNPFAPAPPGVILGAAPGGSAPSPTPAPTPPPSLPHPHPDPIGQPIAPQPGGGGYQGPPHGGLLPIIPPRRPQ